MGCCYDLLPDNLRKPKAILPSYLLGAVRLTAGLISFSVSGYALIHFNELSSIKIFTLLILMALAWSLHAEYRRSKAYYDLKRLLEEVVKP